MNRKIKNEIKIKNMIIGGNNKILIQSMTNTKTKNIDETIQQINDLENEGCEIVRVTVKDVEDAQAIKHILKKINIPLVGDIHFNYKLAIIAIENGINKIRINPGNISKKTNLKKIVDKAKEYNIPIRVGINSGSLEQEFIDKYDGVTPEGLVESGLKNINLLESMGFTNIVLSLKASNVPFALKAYRLANESTIYPLHIGITEAGTMFRGSIKSAVGIGTILADGIGDTIRVSITSNPIDEIAVAKEILQSLGLRKFRTEVISCPTCGRTEIDLIGIAKDVEEYTANINKNLTIAVMGCIVNGPGEAKEADIGIAGGRGVGIIFKKGKVLKKVKEENLLSELKKLINDM